jgi:predicted AAA+ superfamily ATPase
MLVDKRRYDPPSPAQLLSDLPADLVELCDALIRRDPAQRPDTQAMLARFNALSLEATQTTMGGVTDAPLVGRVSQLAALRAAYRALAAGRSSIVYVHGSSGMGKSVLVRRGLDEMEQPGHSQ